MARGRQAIARGDVTARSWWTDIDIGDPTGAGRGLIRDFSSSDAQEQHWYWFGNDRGITGILLNKPYAKPQEALFHELRPDTWDEKPKYARLYNSCGDDDCINPWHWKLSHRGGVPLDETGKLRALTEEDVMARLAETDLIIAYKLYILFMENWDAMEDAISLDSMVVQLNYENTKRLVDKHGDDLNSWDIENTHIIALVEKWLDSERLMTIQTARGRADEISMRRLEQRNRLKAQLARKVSDARRRSGIAVKPRPRRRS